MYCRILATRLVLTGPPPCELVDVKFRLTFRCFMRQQPSGSIFCSTSDLALVRSEVSIHPLARCSVEQYECVAIAL